VVQVGQFKGDFQAGAQPFRVAACFHQNISQRDAGGEHIQRLCQNIHLIVEQLAAHFFPDRGRSPSIFSARARRARC